MGGGGGESNTVSEFKPPDYTQQPWQQYVSDLSGLTGQEMPRYQGQTVAGVNDQQALANSMLINTAINGNPAANEAQSMAYLTLNGAFDNPYATQANPYGTESAYMDQVIDRANQKTLDAYNLNQSQNQAGHALSRTMGSGKQMLQQQDMAEALGEGMQGNALNALNQNYYGNQGIAENQLNRATSAVDAERNRQMQAMGMAPGMQQMDLQAIQAMMGGGDALRGYEQDLLNAQMQDWTAWQQSPYAQLDVMGSGLTRASGGAGTTSSQILGGMSPLQGLLGLGMLGAGAYNAWGG
jgi:hypothetical protein